MYLEAKETARLYKLLTEKLGSDTTEAMFKYIDNKTERSVEATIKILATKDDIANLRKEMGDGISNLRKEMGDDIARLGYNLSKDISNAKADNTRWMFIFWVGQLAATLAIIFLYLKK